MERRKVETRITAADLEAACEWLEAYEDLGTEDNADEVAGAIRRVAAWMRHEISTRQTRKMAREHGKSVGEMRALIDEAKRRGLF